MAVDHTIMLIVAVFSTECCWANRASEMIDMVFAVERSNVGSAEGASAIEA